MIFIYLHGFNSKGNPTSDKVKVIGKLGDVITLNYDSFDRHDDILMDLEEKVKNELKARQPGEVAIVGTSLGAYWAAVFSDKYSLPGILLNPSIQPSNTLKKYVGLTLKNFVNNEINILTEDVPNSYPVIPKKGMLLIMIDEGDEVLDTNETKKFFADYNPILFKGGSHKFEHMPEALPHIKRFLNLFNFSWI